MTTAYTSLLGLALPVTGELDGTWGDVVNNSITTLLDSAIAGTTTISTDADVTLTTTTGSANQAREAILLWTANGTTTRNITAPAQSKIYTVINASAGTQSIVLRGAGPTTGVTILKGESALCAWNGSDFIKISNTSGAGVFTSVTDSSLTSGRVTYATTGGLLTDSANMTFDGTTLTITGLSNTGNTTLGDASTDTVRVNGYIGVGAAGDASNALRIESSALTGIAQTGVVAIPTSTSAATTSITAVYARPNTVAASFTAGSAYGYFSANSTKGAGSTITNQHGLYIEDLTSGTNNYGITSAVSSGTNKWNIYASGTANNYFAGNVGIGTSSPNANLAVYGATAPVIALQNSTTGATSSDGLQFYVVGSTGYIDFKENGSLNFLTNGSERMRIDSAGNVGIGVTNPASYGKFNVATTLAEGDCNNYFISDSTKAGQIVFYDSAAQGVIRYDHANDAMSFKTNATTRLIIDTSGNLGLGVTPSTWSTGKAFEIRSLGNGLFSDGVNDVNIVSNAYYNAGWKYAANGYANEFTCGNAAGTFTWRQASNNTLGAGQAISSWTTAMTLDASGRLLVGTTNAYSNQFIAAMSSGAGTPFVSIQQTGDNPYVEMQRWSGGASDYMGTRIKNVGGSIAFETSNITAIGSQTFSERARIDSSGNFMVGDTAGESKANVFSGGSNGFTSGTLPPGMTLYGTTTDGYGSMLSFKAGAGAQGISGIGSFRVSGYQTDLRFYTNDTNNGNAFTERARINSSGNLLVGTTAAVFNTTDKVTIVNSSAASYNLVAVSSSAAYTGGGVISGSSATTAGTGFRSFSGYSSSGLNFQVLGNGNVQNTNNSYGAISDVKLKENITDATPKLAQLNQVRVVNYNLIGDEHKQLGVIAQELEQVFPSMVEETPDCDKEGNNLGTTTKSVKYSVFVPMLIKALQEQQAIIQQLQADVAALKGQA